MIRPIRVLAPLLCLLLLAGCIPPAGGLRGIVKIGLVAPFSGAARADGYSIIYSVKLALNEWNERGGAHGYRFELVALDDNADPATAAQRARELTVDPLVLGVVGHYGGDTTLAALPEYRAATMPLVVPLASATEAVMPDWAGTVRIAAGDAQYAALLAAQNNATWKAQRILTVNQDTPAYRSMLTAVTSAIGREKIVTSTIAPAIPTKETMDTLMEQVSKAHPDLVFYSGGREVAVDLAGRLRASLPRVQLVLLPAPQMDTPDLVKLGGVSLENAVYGALWNDPATVNDPAMVRFRTEYQKLAGGAPRSSSVLAYDAANVLFAAIDRAITQDGRPTRAGVARVLRDVQWHGLSGEIRFTNRGEAANASAYLDRIVVGRYPGEPVASR